MEMALQDAFRFPTVAHARRSFIWKSQSEIKFYKERLSRREETNTK